MELGVIGIWSGQLDLVPQARAQEHAAELEELGYGTLWLPEAVGREALVGASLLLSATTRLAVATGVANIWARDPMAMAAGHKTLTEAFPERFLLGLGVSHQPAVDFLRGHSYGRPLAHMRAYLDAMDSAIFFAAEPTTPTERVLAALGPRMIELAAERSTGAHTYFVPPEHTAQARDLLGPDRRLCVEQAVVLETDPTAAREVGREYTSLYLGLDNYVNNLRRLGWDDADLADGGSDALVDALVAWGDLDAIVARVQDHRDAGADHVCVQALPRASASVPLAEWRELAPALLG